MELKSIHDERAQLGSTSSWKLNQVKDYIYFVRLALSSRDLLAVISVWKENQVKKELRSTKLQFLDQQKCVQLGESLHRCHQRIQKQKSCCSKVSYSSRDWLSQEIKRRVFRVPKHVWAKRWESIKSPSEIAHVIKSMSAGPGDEAEVTSADF